MNEGLVRIKGLKIRTRIGVPDEERAGWQELRIDLEMTPKRQFSKMSDDISATVDYHAVCEEIGRLAETGSRHLIETLADEVADLILGSHPVENVKVSVRKFILPQTDWVGVEVSKG
ncbi:dihydroneopterin aldolase [Haloferula sp.]|uniref:dihydroneopterin aldolase n=1 Tax=Haloferula sp. TaxID=2497595 RepID=UPI00329CE9BA